MICLIMWFPTILNILAVIYEYVLEEKKALKFKSWEDIFCQ